ncbi:DUF2971 domain-containing protein [Algoriphagus resistens]|uniref:DUF2971 domain-containing protein n=1 Tax=Algoriphagus resistens TaxID=1750590 RepID=UPI000716C500|nr:DUF2971 domain-containing protein [Algoriphagus resistens]
MAKKIFKLHTSKVENDWFTSSIQPTDFDVFGEKVETISRFDSDTIIWRYLDFSKFIALLETKQLHFTRLDDFYDKFEGSYSPSDYERFLSDDFLTRIENSLLSQLIDISVRLGNFASSWHINNYENYGMWKSYVKSNEGVAIKTTVGNLIKSLRNSKSSLVYGNIEYVDFEELDIRKYFEHNKQHGVQVMPIPSFFKRKSFSFENEFRVVIYFEFGISNTNLINQDYIDNIIKSQKRFYQESIDLNELFNEIYIHPDSTEWFDTLVRKVGDRYNVDATILKSDI